MIGVAPERGRDDAELVYALKSGDDKAFEELVVRHRARIVRQARRVLGDLDLAESAAQEVLLRLYQSIGSFRADALFTTWLHKVTANVCLTRLQKERRERAKLETLARENGEDSHMASADGGGSAPDFAALTAGLNHDDQQLLALRFVHDYELRDIANILDLGLSATKMRLYRVLDKLRCAAEADLRAA